MNLIAIAFSAVVVVLIALKIKDADAGYGTLVSIAGCAMIMYFVVSKIGRAHV